MTPSGTVEAVRRILVVGVALCVLAAAGPSLSAPRSAVKPWESRLNELPRSRADGRTIEGLQPHREPIVRVTPVPMVKPTVLRPALDRIARPISPLVRVKPFPMLRGFQRREPIAAGDWRVARTRTSAEDAGVLQMLGEGGVRVSRSEGIIRVDVPGRPLSAETSSITGLTKCVLEQSRARGLKGQPLLMSFKGFTLDEARGAVRSVQAASEAGAIAIHASAARIRAAKNEMHDFANAKIEKVETRQNPDGSGEIIVRVEVPMAGKPSAWFRVKTFFRSFVPDLKARVERIVQSVLSRLGRASEFAAAMTLHSSLKPLSKSHPDDSVLIQIEPPVQAPVAAPEEALDFKITTNEESNAGARSRAA